MNNMDRAFIKKVSEIAYGFDREDWQDKSVRDTFQKYGIDGVLDGQILPKLVDIRNIPCRGDYFNDGFMELMAEFGGYIYSHSKEAYYTMAFFAMNRA